jgi:hypothetical protein
MILHDTEHTNFAVHIKTIIQKIQCEHNLAAWLTLAILSLPYWRKVGEKNA